MSGPSAFPTQYERRLDRHEVRAVAEELRRVDDAARLPVAEPRCRGGVHIVSHAVTGTARVLVECLVHLDDRDLREIRVHGAQRHLPDARRSLVGAAWKVVLVGRARVLGNEEAAVHRRLDVVRLVDLVEGSCRVVPESAGAHVVALDEDRDVRVERVADACRVEHELVDAPVRRLRQRRGRA